VFLPANLFFGRGKKIMVLGRRGVERNCVCASVVDADCDLRAAVAGGAGRAEDVMDVLRAVWSYETDDGSGAAGGDWED
jgi:hypothetical protein